MSVEEPPEFILCVSFATFNTQASWSGLKYVHFCPSILLYYRPPLHQINPHHMLYSNPRHMLYSNPRHMLYSNPRHMLYSNPRHMMYSNSSHMLYLNHHHMLYSNPHHILYTNPYHMLYSTPRHMLYSNPRHMFIRILVTCLFESSSPVYSNPRHMLYSNQSLTISTINPSWRGTHNILAAYKYRITSPGMPASTVKSSKDTWGLTITLSSRAVVLAMTDIFNNCWTTCFCCLPIPMTNASGGSPMLPLVVHQPASPSIWPAVQSLRRVC